MKKWIALAALSCLMLSACAAMRGDTTAPTTVPSTQEPTQSTIISPTLAPTQPTTVPSISSTTHRSITFEVYYPDDALVTFLHKSVTLEELNADAVLAELMAMGIVSGDVTLNSAVLDGRQLNLDLSGSFLNQLYSVGTTGERFLLGSIVNTFLSAYGAESVMITVDGNVMESGHIVYDFALSFME